MNQTNKEKYSKLPQDAKQALKAELSKINECNSSQLLHYSKELHAEKKLMSIFILKVLNEAIDERTAYLNNDIDEIKQCRHQKMVNDFRKGAK